MKGAYKKILILMVVSLIIMGLGLTAQVLAKEVIVWRIATKMPPRSTEGRAFQLFADKIEEHSEGRMRIDVYPSEQLGSTDSILEMLRAGTVHLYPEGPGYLMRYVPLYAMCEMPFVFEDRAHWKRFMDSPMMKEAGETLREEYGITLIGDTTAFVRGPYRVLVSKKPVLSLKDIQGMKLRMAPHDVLVATWEALGANPIILEWTATYESLQRGLVDACTSPIGLVDGMKFQEVAKYILRTDNFPQGMAFMANAKAFENLPSDLQEAVLKAHKEASEFTVRIMYTEAEEVIGRMVKNEGVTFIRAPMTPFIEKLKPIYEKWEKEGKIPQGIIKYIKDLK
ncbi:Sialic acid-binding periplasmic protein SiaP [subsurface metagenome]|nr:C4-dicarboxylate ABC transporter substrate-binding protein [Clostridia bacterium]